MNELAGKTALVTGSGRGIGKEIARLLGTAGANIVISDIAGELASQTAVEFQNSNIKTLAVAGDISKSEDVEAIFKSANEAFGGVDILVNNAGITRDNLLARMDEKDWDLVMSINLKGAFLCIKAAARGMMKNRFGRIVNVSSVVGIMGNAGQANYSASKAGLIGLTKSAAKELAGRNITVNAVAPGYIATEMTKNLPEEAKERFLKSIPLGRPGTPEDISKAVLFFVSEAASYITGQVIHIDGGMLM
jgi:3-oxoacyl-[acyl-carrier protein] reductase